ncbi:hypothetical protein QWI17_15035 [Gilvimarinus sp. SDUM040013]|uniref:DUF2127 domain-containing protein n=1 Tax=Gilvimarinus gilvus TaxID=3058038 RepID=A0ABU4S182_9GAMM|nr:hypothetical protein [Gilvimarinus sp. SDUM040013]MDO3387160.1 hypothetical protein [Gilvimarinus sp. SDUM040013]MDX6850903.1 hypothetical protein [Gilvimarinus sp. SDUM040013]
MSPFNRADPQSGNGLYQLAAAGGFLLGLFLLAGATGHLSAVWATALGAEHRFAASQLSLLLPGLILALAAGANLLTCRALWRSRRWALHVVFAINAIATLYFAYLLQRGVPGHPIGFFLAVTASQLVIITSIKLGLLWPAERSSEQADT